MPSGNGQTPVQNCIYSFKRRITAKRIQLVGMDIHDRIRESRRILEELRKKDLLNNIDVKEEDVDISRPEVAIDRSRPEEPTDRSNNERNSSPEPSTSAPLPKSEKVRKKVVSQKTQGATTLNTAITNTRWRYISDPKIFGANKHRYTQTGMTVVNHLIIFYIKYTIVSNCTFT